MNSATTALCASAFLFTATPAAAQAFEVWLVDQSNSPGKSYGGAIHVYDGAALNGNPPADLPPSAVIDLSGTTAALCQASTGADPVRPHMLFFNATEQYAVLSFVASGHVVILDAESRMPIACFRSSPGAGGARQAHAAVPSPDDTYILVANQNGKLLERIDTDYTTRTFTQNAAATLNLASCTTPNGEACQAAGIRPDNAPICPLVDSTGSLGFVTLRGGGLFVVDPRATPIGIVGEYDMPTVHGNGCGGAQAGGSMFIDSGGATAANLSEFDVYRFPLTGYAAANGVNTPAPTVVFSDDLTPDRDAHGITATKAGRYIWVADRHSGVIEVFETATNARVATLDVKTAASSDPSPDLMDIAPAGNRMFVSLRGPNPLSGDPHVATGSTPGMMVMRIEEGGRRGEVIGIVRISNVDSLGVERADAHGIRIRRR
jgi:DNA-binding beta-propeller fold protein YncE